MSAAPEPTDPQVLVYATEVRDLYRRERARADELQRAKEELEATNRRLVAEIEERELAEAALRQAQKMEAIGELTGGIAHDFNNLLSVIINYAALLEDQLSDDAAAVEDVREIRKAGQRAADLTRQLLTFSRKEAIHPRVVRLGDVVAGVDKMLQSVVGKGIHLVSVTDEAEWPVKIDPGQLEQVVLNLVVNARDAMPGGGTLTLRTADRVVDAEEAAQHPGLSPGEYAVLITEDTGVGMDSDVRERVFEPFFTTKERDTGTGLGLSMVYGIVKGANGYISCESELHEGTKFTVFLPRAADTAEDL